MSLSGIFDPAVRAYFKKLFGGDSSGGTGSLPDGVYVFAGREKYYFEGLRLARCGDYLEIAGIELLHDSLADNNAFYFLYVPSGTEIYTSKKYDVDSPSNTMDAVYTDDVLTLIDMDDQVLLINTPVAMGDDFPAGLYINPDVIIDSAPCMILYDP